MKTLTSALLSVAATLLTVAPAYADSVSYTLTTLNPTISSGSTLTFNGSIVAPASNTGAVSLLGDSFSVNGPATLDDTAFFSTPASLDPGGSYAGALFSLTLPTNAAAGSYAGNFDILVGLDNGQSTISGPFEYTVAGNTPTVTPEPGSWLLLSTGLAGVGMLRRRLQARF